MNKLVAAFPCSDARRLLSLCRIRQGDQHIASDEGCSKKPDLRWPTICWGIIQIDSSGGELHLVTMGFPQ